MEKYILGSPQGIRIATRYFPTSIKKWQNDPSRPADIMIKIPYLKCVYTGEDLLKPEPRGIIVFGWNASIKDRTHYDDIYWCLKGEPDRILAAEFRKRNLITAWKDIPDIIIPTVFISWCIAPLNQLRSGCTYSDVAFEKLKRFIITVFPYVARDLSEEEKQRVQSLMDIPAVLGGLAGS